MKDGSVKDKPIKTEKDPKIVVSTETKKDSKIVVRTETDDNNSSASMIISTTGTDEVKNEALIYLPG